MKVIQINLGRSKVAHDMAFATAAKLDIDLMVVCEPNHKITAKNAWIADRNKDVAVFIRNRNVRVKKCQAGGRISDSQTGRI